MRTVVTGFLACCVCLVATVSVLAQPQPRPDPRPGNIETAHLSGVVVQLAPQIPDRVIVGLAPGSPLEILTWERVYALALVHARDRRGGLLETMDPMALAERAKQHRVSDFSEFRKEFLAGGTAAGTELRDPSADFLDLLRRLQTIDNTRREVGCHENLFKLIAELLQGESKGLSQLDLDLVQASLIRARERLSNETASFCDALDALKLTLGLSPHAAVFPDRRNVAAFPARFDAVDWWLKDPGRNLAVLHELVEQLPPLGEVLIEGRPVLGGIDPNPERMEDVLRDAARIAVKDRGELGKGQPPADGEAQLELRVRRRIRHLLETRRAYTGAKQSYERAVRVMDQVFERMVAPAPGAHSSPTPWVGDLLEQYAQTRNAEDRLVAQWASFRAERLALYRDMGSLPYGDWNAFYADLSAARGDAREVRPGPAERAQPAALPPPPPPPPPPPRPRP